jgi:integrase
VHQGDDLGSRLEHGHALPVGAQLQPTGALAGGDLTTGRSTLGEPLQANNIGERQFAKLVKAAGVRRIKFHGLRHTSATLQLQAGVPLKVVQERLNHKKLETTSATTPTSRPRCSRTPRGGWRRCCTEPANGWQTYFPA